MKKNSNEVIDSLKQNSLDKAWNVCIKITSDLGVAKGFLLPVGSWILGYPTIIEKISNWRKVNMKNFLVQFESTPKKSLEYLKRFSIDDKKRLFFLIFDSQKKLIGHIGLSHIDQESAELDNLVRGEKGGDLDLIFYAEKTILDFAFDQIRVKEIILRVLSYNYLALNIHNELGFKVLKSSPLLKKRNSIGDVVHEVSTCKESNVKYTCLTLGIQKMDPLRD